MITLGRAAFQKEARVDEFYGLSTDDKDNMPNKDDIPNGSSLFMMDTSQVYLWDKDNQMWREV